MSKQIYINFPVASVEKSIAFWEALGFRQDPRFSAANAACFVLGDTIFLMLLPHDRFRDFTTREICDTQKAVEVLLSLSCDSREEVNSLVAKALAAGGTAHDEPDDYGFMYSHSFIDLDGHGWGVLHMTGTPH